LLQDMVHIYSSEICCCRLLSVSVNNMTGYTFAIGQGLHLKLLDKLTNHYLDHIDHLPAY